MSFWKWLRLAGTVGLASIAIAGFLVATLESSQDLFTPKASVSSVSGKTGL
jgi:hypothetical protein